jgi:hypothetical protein
LKNEYSLFWDLSAWGGFIGLINLLLLYAARVGIFGGHKNAGGEKNCGN